MDPLSVSRGLKIYERALAAVKISGYALQHASAELCVDRDFVLAAVASNGYALRQTSLSSGPTEPW